MFKDILVVLDEARASSYALHLARQFGADLTAAWSHDASAFATVSQAEVRYDMVTNVAELEPESAVCAQKFIDQAQAVGVKAHTLEPVGGETGARRELSAWARLFDLVVIDQPSRETARSPHKLISSLISDCGRPVLIVPRVESAALSPESVMIAWDASVPAARALGDALPLLKRARSVEIVTVPEEFRAPILPSGADVVQHLARHGISAKFTEIAEDLDVGATLLSYASEIRADLIVAGAYGHSPLAAKLFGSTTGALFDSMAVPFFVSH
jgi:nucleotide-binding universal stress UspA family protein